MERLSSFRGDKHSFCLVVMKFRHVGCYKLPIDDRIELSNSYFVKRSRYL